jgi:hypothetical protein
MHLRLKNGLTTPLQRHKTETTAALWDQSRRGAGKDMKDVAPSEGAGSRAARWSHVRGPIWGMTPAWPCGGPCATGSWRASPAAPRTTPRRPVIQAAPDPAPPGPAAGSPRAQSSLSAKFKSKPVGVGVSGLRSLSQTHALSLNSQSKKYK